MPDLFPGATLSATSGIPVPTGSVGFPPITAPQVIDPLGSYNPFTGASLATGTLPAQRWGPAPVGAGVSTYTNSPMGRYLQERQFAMLRAKGLPLDSNPSDWTPEEAAAQTQTALAKISTVNPALAKELAAQQAGQAHADGGGFWHSLLNLAGDVFKPAISFGGKILNIIARPAHIIPALLTNDPNEKSGIWDDIGGALSGANQDTWSGVLQQWGVKNGLLRGVLGFVGDVLTDPVTYLFPAGAGAHFGEIGAQVGREVATQSVARRLVETGGGDVAAIAENLGKLHDTYLGGLERSLASRGIHNPELGDVLAGAEMQGLDNATRSVVGDMWEISSTVANRVTIGRRLNYLPESIPLSSGRAVTPQEVMDIVSGRATLSGVGVAGRREAFKAARMYASVLPGWNLKFSLPLTNLKFMSGSIPFTDHLNFNLARQMFAGQYGMNRLAEAIQSGHASEGDLTTWMESGWSSFASANPAVAELLKGRGTNLGHWLYSTSERIGNITGALTPHASAYRAGLASYTMSKDLQQSKRLAEGIQRVIGRTYRDGQGGVQEWPELLKEFEDNLGWSYRDNRRLEYVGEDAQRRLDNQLVYRDGVPPGLKNSDEVTAWWNSRPDVAADAGDPELAAVWDARKNRLLEAFNELSDGERATLDKASALTRQMHEALNQAGVFQGSIGYENMPSLNATDTARWQGLNEKGVGGTVPALRGQVLHMAAEDPTVASIVNSHGIDDAMVAAGGEHDIAGIHATLSPSGGPSVVVKQAGVPSRVSFRLSNPLVLDDRPGALLNQTEYIDQANQTYLDQEDAFRSVITEPGRADEAWRQNGAAIKAEFLKSHGFDGVIHYQEDGTMHVTAFDHHNVMPFEADQREAGRIGGFLPRRFSDPFKKYLEGQRSEVDPAVIYGVRGEEDFARKYAHLPVLEAEARVRNDMNAGDFEGPIYERNQLALHDRYAHHESQLLLDELFGRVAARALWRDQLAPTYLGRHILGPTYRWPGVDTRSAERLGAHLSDAVDTYNYRVERLAARLHEEQVRASNLAAHQRAALDTLAPAVTKLEEPWRNVSNSENILISEIRKFETARPTVQRGAGEVQPVADLAKDIQTRGFQNPIDVQVNRFGDSVHLQVRDGLHRLEAAEQLGLKRVPIRLVEQREGTGFYHPVNTLPSKHLPGRFTPELDSTPRIKVAGRRYVAGGTRSGASVRQDISALERSLQGLKDHEARYVAARKAAGKVFTDQEFEQHVALGRLYAAPDGTVMTAKGLLRKRGTKLYSLLDVQGQQALVQEDITSLRRMLQEGRFENRPISAKTYKALAAQYQLEHVFEDRVAKGIEKLSAAERASARKVGHWLRQVQNAQNEVNHTTAALRSVGTKVRAALVPIDKSQDLTEFVQLKGIPGLEGYAAHRMIANEMHEAFRGLADPGALHDAWRHWVMGPWKRWATYRFLGFHVRNNYGAWFNNWLGGTTAKDYHAALGALFAGDGKEAWMTKVIPDKLFDETHLHRLGFVRGTSTYGDIADHVSDIGINRMNTTSVFGVHTGAEQAAEVSAAHGMKGIPLRGLRKLDRIMQHIGSTTEDYHRIAGWFAGMRRFEGDSTAARAFVMLRQGDYADLNGFENGIVRDVIPFYKWLRTNTPYQLHMLAENPALMTGVGKAKHAVYVAEGFDQQMEEAKMPAWMKETTSIPIPGLSKENAMQMLTLDLPMADLFNGLNDYMSSILPMVRPFVESYGVHKTFFSGKDLKGTPIPLTGWLNLPGIRDLLKGTGIAQADVNGKLTIDDQTANWMGGWPVFSRFRDFVMADPGRVNARANLFTSTLLGLGLRSMGPQQATDAELAFFHEQVDPLMVHLRGLGVIFPDKNNLSPAAFTDLGFEPPVNKVTPTWNADGTLSTAALTASTTLPNA